MHLLVRVQYHLERRYSVPLTKANSCSTSQTVLTLYLLDITYTVSLRSMYSLSLRRYLHCTSQKARKPCTVPVRQYVFSISQLVPTICLRNLKHYVWDKAFKVPFSVNSSSPRIRSDSWSFSWRSWICLLSSSETEGRLTVNPNQSSSPLKQREG